MIACKMQTNISESGSLTLDALPFPAGTSVEVIVMETDSVLPVETDNAYPLHNTPFRYDQPFDPVALDDWEVLK